MSAPRRRHVLVARLDNDGDVLLQGPAIRAVAHGAGRVTLLHGPRGRRAAGMLPGVDATIEHRAEWIDPEAVHFDPANSAQLVARMRNEARPDAAVILTSFHQSPLPLALLLRMAGVPWIAATSVDFPGSLLDVRHRISDDVHEVERALSLAAACGFALPPGDDGAMRIERLPPAGAARVRPFPAGEPFLVVHPGASVTARAWAPERNAELVAALAARGRRVAVTGGPDERALTRFVAERARAALAAGRPAPADAAAASATGAPVDARIADLGGATSFAELAEVIAQAEAIVVGNTGPAHLAAAVGTPVASIYAPTVPAARWRPWRVPHELLHVDVPCAGCRARTCPVPGHPCVDDLPLQTVLDAVDRLAPDDGPAFAAEPDHPAAPLAATTSPSP